MMSHLGINMRVVCKKAEVLEKLKENRTLHAKLVQEAQDGYLAKAMAELDKKLGEVKEGKLVALTFQLKVPKAFTSAYDTTIAMLEAHQAETIELSADEFRHLMQDEWDWTREFIMTNSSYSSSTRHWSSGKGVDLD